jgi:hypothetical protein
MCDSLHLQAAAVLIAFVEFFAYSARSGTGTAVEADFMSLDIMYSQRPRRTILVGLLEFQLDSTFNMLWSMDPNLSQGDLEISPD